MESKVLEMLTSNTVASRNFARTPSRIRRIVKIGDIVDRFLRKLFWFFLSIFLVLGFMRFCSRAFGHYGCKRYTSAVLGYSEVTILREGEDASLCPAVYCILIIYGITVSEQYVVKFLGLHEFRGYFIWIAWSSILQGVLQNKGKTKQVLGSSQNTEVLKPEIACDIDNSCLLL